MRASAPAGVALEPPGGSGGTGWGVLCVVSVGARVLSFKTWFCLTMASLCGRGVFKRGDWIETELNDPSVGARRGSDEEVFSF